MISDNTTFFLAFTTVFLGIAVYVWMLDRRARRLSFRISVLEQRGDATAKKDNE